MKLSVEQCTSIHISHLQKEIRKLISRDYPDATEDEIFNYTMGELNKFTVNGQTFEYTSSKNVLGGYRWFFVCPKCKERVSKLFLPPEGFTNYAHVYSCKKCHKLLNESVLKANNKLYKNVIRPLKHLREIENKLEKGHLTQDKVDLLLNEYDAIEKEMKECPEYRLYTFKKRRGMGLL